jgi:hypothetical protein
MGLGSIAPQNVENQTLEDAVSNNPVQDDAIDEIVTPATMESDHGDEIQEYAEQRRHPVHKIIRY